MRVIRVVFTILCLVSFWGCTKEKGVLINGVVWATRNIDSPGNFVIHTYDSGMFYQWNSKIGWSTNPIRSTHGATIWYQLTDTIAPWSSENDPSPKGWRLPTNDDWKKLLNTNKVSRHWATQEGVEGLLFIDKQNKNRIFFPATGYINDQGELKRKDIQAHYASNTNEGKWSSYLFFVQTDVGLGSSNVILSSYNVRCVAK